VISPLLKAADDLLPGFSNPVFDSQRVFRKVLEALAHPGSVYELAPLPPAPVSLHPASAAICLALLDFETPLWLQPGLPVGRQESITRHLRFHCGCPIVDAPIQSSFALIHDAASIPSLASFAQSEIEYPDRSATLIVQVAGLDAGPGVMLRGPGIWTVATLGVPDLPAAFWSEWCENAARFPCGVDLILVAGKRIAGLPRTTLAEA